MPGLLYRLYFCPMEIRHLRLIKVLAEEGGINKSLEKLYLTQSAVSHQLKDIEERLGARIFYRIKNKWRLTEEGEILYRSAQKILEELDQSLLTIRELRQGQQGVIRISTECYTNYYWFPKFMQKMGLLYPKLEIKINMEGTQKPLQKLLEHELDLAITSDPIPDKHLKYTELFKHEVLAVAHPEHPWARKKYISAEDFADQKLIIHSYPLESVTVYQHFLKPHGQKPLSITAVPMTEITLEMVRANMGVTCMPLWVLKSFVSLQDLKTVKIGRKGLFRTHYAAMRTADLPKKYLVDFVAHLREELG